MTTTGRTARIYHIRQDPTRINHTRQDPFRIDHTRQDPTRNDHNRQDPNRIDHTKQERQDRVQTMLDSLEIQSFIYCQSKA